MKTPRILSLLVLLLMATLGLQAQNGNAVVSEIKLYDMGDGTGILAVRVSGNQAYLYTGGSFAATGDRIPGGSAGGGIGSSSRVHVVSPAPGNGNGNSNGNQAVILTALVPLTPSSGNQPDFVSIDLRVEGDGRVFYHWGSTVSVARP